MTTKLRATAIAVVCLLASGCYNSERRQAKDLLSKINATMAATHPDAPQFGTDGSFANGLPEGCYLRATINGKRWEATAMTPDLDRSSIVEINGKNTSGFINFTIGMVNIKTGKPRKFNDQHTLLYWDENNESWLAKSGECLVKKVDQHFIEGTFYFTVDNGNQSIICMNGEFRVPTPPCAQTN